MAEIKPLILLVDDDPLIIRMYQKGLIRDGFEVKTAFNGEEALAIIKESKPDLILLDIMMPKKNGVETLQVLKEDPRYKDIPVFVLTNIGDNPEDIKKVKELGAKDYFVKVDVSAKELVRRIKEELKQNAR